MSRRFRPFNSILTAAAFAVPLSIVSSVSATTYVFSNPTGGALNQSTNYAPSGIPGTADTLRLNALPTIPGFLTLRVAANQTIGRIELNQFAPTTINADLDGSGTPFVLTLATGALALLDAMTEAPDVPLDTAFINAPLAGGSGLVKTGPGFAYLSSSNLYTGGTTISGPGGLDVGKDAALGATAGGVFLNTGGTLRAISSFATSRTLSIDPTGGRLEAYGTLTLNGAIGGSGTLTVGRFTGGTIAINSTTNSFSGGLVIAQSNTVNLLGRLGSVSSITLGGTLNLGVGNVGPTANAINDAAPISSLGGTINLAASATSTTETLGAITLSGGTTTLNLTPTVNGGTQLAFASLTRSNRSTAFIRGRDLGGGALAGNRALVTFADTSNLPVIGGGGTTATNASIVPFLFGNASTTGGISQVSVVEAGLVTRGATGLRALATADYATTLATNAPTNNVRVSDGIATQNTNVTANALVIRDTLASTNGSGVMGAGTITLTSGTIVAVSDLAGEELSINNALNFNAVEGIIHTAPTSDGYAQLTLRGAISGSNGLTKSGNGELYLENTASTYSGVTTINGGTVTFTGNVAVNAAGALGNSNADVIINAGVSGTTSVGLRAATPMSTFARNIIVRQNANANSLAFIGTLGGYGASFTGQITVEGGFLNLGGDAEPAPLTFAGPIVGAGGLQEPAVSQPPLQFLRLTGTNTYAGGTEIRAARWEVGSNTALGSGTVYFVGNNTGGTQSGAIQPFGGARSLGNALVLRASPIFSGVDPLTFTGPVDLGSVAQTVNVTSTADVTFAGIVSRGGLIKTGPGRLVLAGANTYNNYTLVSAGTLRAANNSALGVSTGPAGFNQATFITGTGAVELAGGITTDEPLFFGSGGQPITAASATGNLRNATGNNTLTGQIAFDNVGTIGVDAGSSLTFTGDTVDNTLTGNAALRKVGAGLLSVKNVRLPTLAVNAGTLRILAAGPPNGTSRVSSLTVTAGATLDLTNNALVYDYTTTSPIITVRSLLASGAIMTSVATPGAAVGYADASSLFVSNTFPQSFYGQQIDDTTLLLLETLRGDANLDRIVDFNDLLVVAQNFGQTSNQVWRNGDFNYDGAIDFADLLSLAQNFGLLAGTDGLNFDAAPPGFADDWALAQSLVPEPTSLLVFASVAALQRRRR